MMRERSGKKRARKAREVGCDSLTTVRTTGSGPRKSLSDRLAHGERLSCTTVDAEVPRVFS
jgi:hypothetical protein